MLTNFKVSGYGIHPVQINRISVEHSYLKFKGLLSVAKQVFNVFFLIKGFLQYFSDCKMSMIKINYYGTYLTASVLEVQLQGFRMQHKCRA